MIFDGSQCHVHVQAITSIPCRGLSNIAIRTCHTSDNAQLMGFINHAIDQPFAFLLSDRWSNGCKWPIRVGGHFGMMLCGWSGPKRTRSISHYSHIWQCDRCIFKWPIVFIGNSIDVCWWQMVLLQFHIRITIFLWNLQIDVANIIGVMFVLPGR